MIQFPTPRRCITSESADSSRRINVHSMKHLPLHSQNIAATCIGLTDLRTRHIGLSAFNRGISGFNTRRRWGEKKKLRAPFSTPLPIGLYGGIKTQLKYDRFHWFQQVVCKQKGVSYFSVEKVHQDDMQQKYWGVVLIWFDFHFSKKLYKIVNYRMQESFYILRFIYIMI